MSRQKIELISDGRPLIKVSKEGEESGQYETAHGTLGGHIVSSASRRTHGVGH